MRSLRRSLRLLLLLACALSCAPAARAHSLSTSYLTVVTAGAEMRVQWEIALRDLDYAIGLDPTGRITWGDLRARKPAIIAYALPRLTLSSGSPCPPGPVDLLADERGGNGYAVLRFTARCDAPIRRVGIAYSLMFDLDPQHRALVDVVSGGSFHVAVLSPASAHVTIDAGGRLGRTFAEFFRVGVDHILSGPDHLLFIALLLFPAMFRRGPRGGWRPVERFRPAFVETVEILSSFTVAHAITVTAATLGWVSVPSRVIEGAIALTIVATALDNIVPVLPERRWVLAFGFGLIHGMGFATALGPLSLPAWPLAVALFSFNLGVEAAQLLAALVVLPLGFGLRNVGLYPRRVLPGASGLAGVVALAWFAQRTLQLF